MPKVTSPQKAVEILEKWVDFYPGPFDNFFVIVPRLKSHLKLSTPLFWYAFYTLLEKKKVRFEEPLFFTMSKLVK